MLGAYKRMLFVAATLLPSIASSSNPIPIPIPTLPGLISVGIIILAFIIVLKLLRSKQKNERDDDSVGISIILIVVLFIPSCMGVQKVVESFIYEDTEYEKIEYKKHEQIKSENARAHLPPAATNIVITQNELGHSAFYKISRVELLQWMAEFSSSEKGNLLNLSFTAAEKVDDIERKQLADANGWGMSPDTVKFSAGSNTIKIWHSESSRWAFQTSIYY